MIQVQGNIINDQKRVLKSARSMNNCFISLGDIDIQEFTRYGGYFDLYNKVNHV